MKLPLRITTFRGIKGEISAYIITDTLGRSVHINCEASELRRGVAKLWSPEEAEALAKRIARLLTDDEERKG